MPISQSLNTTLPPDVGEAARIGALRIRQLTEGIRERSDVDHYWPEDDPSAGLFDNADTGEHRQATLRERAVPTSVDANKIILFGKEIGGKSGTSVIDEDDYEKELTKQDTPNSVHVLNIEAKDLRAAGSAALTDDDTLDISAGGLLKLKTGVPETVLGDGLNRGMKAIHADPTAGQFVDDTTLEIDGANGLQIKAGYLATLVGQSSQANGTTDISETTGGWVDMTDLEVTITTKGGNVLLMYHGSVRNAGGQTGVRILVDGVAKTTTQAGTGRFPCSLQWLETGLSAASHTFKVQWQKQSGTSFQDGATYDRVLSVVEQPKAP